jgi:hypothetical protein
MDKVSKLQALLGEGDVSEEPVDWDHYAPHAKTRHLYEGTESDDDKIITSGKVDNSHLDVLEPDIEPMPSKTNMQSAVYITTT